ncbi:ubiquitinyl hydrolase [Microstroma glucosiphilum]|uniref:ubiquitinyl hydrolase 1 n=1 Tax=Pseudomicrostroma glucosiphilum TaxID=1684307 RepID=A0A316UAH9_9BASI|nr:ubiquitinyl hydrolase [Pseudomicrostroma glucosiphilum]PWN21423.1 ubiquitinyl hydrolase [Pseudomicrostroma glucosiphilum]
MSCPHLSDSFTSLSAPRPSQQVHRDECTLCFDDQDGPEGIDVCLICFNGGCTGNGDREHSRLHWQKTGHAIVANVKRRRKARAEQPIQEAPKKLAISAETEEDLYEWETKPKCLACDPDAGGKELPRTEKLESVISAMMKSLSSSQQSEVKAWEEEIVPCNHTRELKQLGEPFSLEADGLAKCGKCDLSSNLWLCLTCGNLGCGRAQFGGVGGNSHGLTHFEESGHPVSVKQGTITAEGTADIYCYACNDARIDPKLAEHLRHFGMNVLDLSKTEKSMTELQLEQNLKFDFNMTGEDGKELEPLFGPGLTGLRNLGNSCYMASTLQALFSFPAFQTRYSDAYRPHTVSCGNTLPATCLECQTGKLADGLLSGRYAVPRPADQASVGSVGAMADVPGSTHDGKERASEGPIFQAGIRPSMFKSLIGKGHEEFSTMRQQDADEFLKHVVVSLQKESRRLSAVPETGGAPTNDPTTIFSFGLEQRLQCMECKKVRYTVEAQDAGLSLPVPLRKKVKQQHSSSSGDGMELDADAKGKAPVEGVNAESDLGSKPSSSGANDKIEYEPVELEECLDIFTAAEELEYNCPSCQKKVIATKRTLFTSFPEVLAIQARRFQLVNWVPQKVDVPILVPLEPFTLDKYLGTGKREDEEELPEGDSEFAGSGAGSTSNIPQFDAAAMSQLTSMGFPEVRCQRALLATGNNGDAEAAMNWLFSHMEDPDIDDPIDFSQASSTPAAAAGTGAASGGGGADTSMLEEMGFFRNQARKALRLNGNNPEMAVAWLFENSDDSGEEEEITASTGSTAAAAAAAAATAAGGEGEGSSAPAATSVLGGSAELPARYHIKAFVSHKGPSVHSGHYVAHVRKAASMLGSGTIAGAGVGAGEQGQGQGQGQGRGQEGESWVFFNDEKVVRAPFEAARSKLQAGGNGNGNENGDGEDEGEQNDVGVKGLSRLAYVYFFERQL